MGVRTCASMQGTENGRRTRDPPARPSREVQYKRQRTRRALLPPNRPPDSFPAPHVLHLDVTNTKPQAPVQSNAAQRLTENDPTGGKTRAPGPSRAASGRGARPGCHRQPVDAADRWSSCRDFALPPARSNETVKKMCKTATSPCTTANNDHLNYPRQD